MTNIWPKIMYDIAGQLTDMKEDIELAKESHEENPVTAAAKIETITLIQQAIDHTIAKSIIEDQAYIPPIRTEIP